MSVDEKGWKPGAGPKPAGSVDAAGSGGTAAAADDAAAGLSTAQLFEQAVRLHTRRLLAIARAVVGTRASPEDVVQQAFMNLYKHRDRYDWRDPGGLLRRTVVNEALRILRQPKMAAMADETGGEGRADAPDADLIQSETVARVRAAIDRLPEHFRSALVLCEYEGMPYAQIAQTLGASVPQIKTWIHRGRRQLAEMLRETEQPNAERKTKNAERK